MTTQELIAPAPAIPLPRPLKKGAASLEKCLAARRSVREYRSEPLTLAEAGQLLWAGQGLSGDHERRTAPSAGALYPLELLLIAGDVEGLEPGIYRYHPETHALRRVVSGDRRERIAAAALEQDSIRHAAATIAITAIARRTTGKYGDRGLRYMAIEVGHAAENILLQATSLGLGAVPVGAFSDSRLESLLELGSGEGPLYLIPAGRV
jgi:SagB-type dehydrogenase family enzyme